MPLYREVSDPYAPGSPTNPYPSTADFTTPGVIDGQYFRQIIYVVNLCVGYHPDPANPTVFNGTNISRLEWLGPVLRWRPPSGEVILEYQGSYPGGVYNPYLSDIVSGSTGLKSIWTSPDSIPDIFIPDGGVSRIFVNALIKNAAGVTNAHIVAAISGTNPTSVEGADYPLTERSFTPGTSGNGPLPTLAGYVERGGNSLYKGNWGASSNTIGSSANRGRFTNSSLTFAAGQMKAYIKALSTKTDDSLQAQWIKVLAGA